ncbi:MAG: hypothetical protein H7099_12170 [Gemmatimonadaceae bacterium]|nr:hypothetical protein [Gemmatimonadaceae bacterium]
MSTKATRLNLLLVPLLAACGGSSGGDVTGNPGGNPPPVVTTATVTIQMTTPGGTIRPGSIYGRDSTLALTRNDMTFQYGRCTGAGPGTTTCTYTVKVGQTVTLVATDLTAAIQASVNTFAADRPDPRTIQSQFTSWSSPCATPERGVCVIRVTDNVTVEAKYKPLNLTTVNFQGAPNYKFTITAPPELLIQNPNPAQQQLVLAAGGPGVGQCIGLSPGKQCVLLLVPDNSTIRLEAIPITSALPMGALGPTRFVGWGSVCAINLTNPTCDLNGGSDQAVTMKWEYYRCVNNGVASPSIGVNGHFRYPADTPTLVSGQCVLVST